MFEKIFSNIAKKHLILFVSRVCFIFSDSKNKINNYFDNWHQIFLNFIICKAKKFKTNILIGSFPYKNKNNKKFLNRSLMICNKGKILSHYDKINLFDVLLDKNEKYFESKNYDSGKKLKVIKFWDS